MARLTTRRVAPLLLGSGFCGLVYQVAWLRELRLVFGASTAASAAVLAIFIGGLGMGGLLLGRRADAARQPLLLYGNLELIVAASAALSPLLLALVRTVYIATGGSFALGPIGGTLLRLVLAALVLAVPTLAMGGTLAAATRAAAAEGDARRRGLAILYGTNTLGAVLGALASTFLLLEVLGTHRTIWVAALLNALIAFAARALARKAGDVPGDVADAHAGADAAGGSPVPRWFVLSGAGIVGFAFFLMEMTWYRMLGPILGGTVFTFGLILAIALLGIGIGGIAYALRSGSRAATLYGLVLTCVIEAIALGVPLALGDRVAFGAWAVRTSAVFGFAGQVLGWAVIASFVILPAAIASGVQFPLLVNLTGRGRAHVGRQLGLVYATNTIGAIVGSLVGGFVLLPALGAVGCWRLATVLLLALGGASLVIGRRDLGRRTTIATGAAIAVACLLVFAPGPTAAWRHGGIGAGRSPQLGTPSAARELVSLINRHLVWESEGVESSVALIGDNGLSFVVNGKIDGNVQHDAATQMMGGIVGALIHPSPKRALVIGLGTGETAGWLADAPGVERVDVIELEESILEVARRCAGANRDVLANQKVSIQLGDAREALLVGDATYDLVFSEPSNPYRAGVSSLYTREFYEAVRDRLGSSGLFLQWTQSYEVDGQTIATVYATLRSVFPTVHTFRLLSNDLLFVASRGTIGYDAEQIAERVMSPVIREAMSYGWGVEGTEGFLSHFLGDTRLANAIAERAGGDLNTDDKTPIEFAFARSLGMTGLQNEGPLRKVSLALGADRPAVTGTVDWARFDELRAYADAITGYAPMYPPALPPAHLARIQARTAYAKGNLAAASIAWKQQTDAPVTHADALLVAESGAATAEPADTSALRPAEAALVRARLHVTRKEWPLAATELAAGFIALRSDVFANPALVNRSLQLARTVSDRDASQAPRLVDALSQPFALYLRQETRILAQLYIAAATDAQTVVRVFAPLEPHVPWRREVLMMRRAAYAETGNPLLERADDDLDELLSGQPSAIAGAADPEPVSPP
jgi:spermidine synthase